MNIGQTGDFAAALAKLDTTKPVLVKDPFIGVGDGTFDVLDLAPFTHEKHGPSVRCTFVTVTAASHKPGDRVVKIWNLCRPSMWPSQPTDADRFADFVRKLSGQPEGAQVGATCAALLRDRVADQLLRGMRIRAYGTDKGKNGKSYVDIAWMSVPQTQDEIRQRRTALETGAPMAAAPAPVAAPAPAPVAAPAPAAPAPNLLSQIPGFSK